MRPLSLERLLTGEHLVHGHRECILIYPAIRVRPRLEQFRGHVLWCADHHLRGCQRLLFIEPARFIDDLRNPKVTKIRLQEPVEENVPWLHVAVEHAAGMDMVERRGDAGQPEVEHPGRVADGVPRFVPPPVICQRSSRQKPHRHERAAVVVTVIGDRHHRLVRRGEHRLDLTGKPLHRRTVMPHFTPWHLDDDRNAGSRIPRPVGHAHAAHAQFRDQAIAAVHRSADTIRSLRDGLDRHRRRLAGRCGGGERVRVVPTDLPVAEPKYLRDPRQVASLGRVGQGWPGCSSPRRVSRRVSHDGLPIDKEPRRKPGTHDRARVKSCRCFHPRRKGMIKNSRRVVKVPHGARAISIR